MPVKNKKVISVGLKCIKNAIIFSEKDNVATTIIPMSAGECFNRVKLVQDIPANHKFSIIPIKAGGFVYKYGEVIGRATQDIRAGEHVHVHNIVSARDAGKKE